MDTTTQNEMSISNVESATGTMVAETLNTQPVDNLETSAEQPADSSKDGAPRDANDLHRRPRNSALGAAHLGHSPVNHVQPHHRGIDL